MSNDRLHAIRFAVIAPKPTEFFHRKEPSAAGAATKKELEVKNRFNHEAHEEHEERSNVTAKNARDAKKCRGGFQTRPTS